MGIIRREQSYRGKDNDAVFMGELNGMAEQVARHLEDSVVLSKVEDVYKIHQKTVFNGGVVDNTICQNKRYMCRFSTYKDVPGMSY